MSANTNHMNYENALQLIKTAALSLPEKDLKFVADDISERAGHNSISPDDIAEFLKEDGIPHHINTYIDASLNPSPSKIDAHVENHIQMLLNACMVREDQTTRAASFDAQMVRYVLGCIGRESEWVEPETPQNENTHSQ